MYRLHKFTKQDYNRFFPDLSRICSSSDLIIC